MAAMTLSSVQPDSTTRVAVVVTPVDNRGDVSSGQKILEVMKETFQNVSLFAISKNFGSASIEENLKKLNASDDPELKKMDKETKLAMLALFQQTVSEDDKQSLNPEARKSLKKIFPHLQFEEELYKRINQYGVIILFPALKEEWLPQQIQRCKVPVLQFSEYGSLLLGTNLKGANIHHLGFSSSEIGVIIPKSLNDYYKAHKEDSSLTKLQNLAGLDPKLQASILGKKYSKEALEEFSKTSKLYVSYAHEEIACLGFIKSLCALASPKENDHVTICVYGDPIKELSKKLHRTLFQQRFRSIVIVKQDGTQVDSLSFKDTDKVKAKGERQLRVVFFSDLPQDAILRLHKAAEPETLATGTQSMLEVIALRKRFHYVINAHLIEFVESFIDILKVKNKGLADSFIAAVTGDFGFAHFKQMRDQYSFIENPETTQQTTAFFKALKEKPEWAQDWENFINEVCEKKNCAQKLREIVLNAIQKEPKRHK